MTKDQECVWSLCYGNRICNGAYRYIICPNQRARATRFVYRLYCISILALNILMLYSWSPISQYTEWEWKKSNNTTDVRRPSYVFLSRHLFSIYLVAFKSNLLSISCLSQSVSLRLCLNANISQYTLLFRHFHQNMYFVGVLVLHLNSSHDYLVFKHRKWKWWI